MTPDSNIWPYAEAQTHLDELLDLAARCEPQRIVQPKGRTLVIPATHAQTVEQQPKPFRSGLSTFLNAPRVDDFNPERLRGTPPDL